MVGTARRLAVALRDDGLRAIVFNAIRTSPAREQKIAFRDFLLSAGARVRSAIGPGVLEALDSVVNLELYLPVRAHRAAWDGDANLLIVTALRDHEPPVGFDLSGRAVLLDPEHPPTVPALVLVPQEQDLSALSHAQCNEDTCGGGGGGGGGGLYVAAGDSLLLVEMHLASDHEGWPRGDPEIMVSVMEYSETSQEFILNRFCAGDGQPFPQGFDINDKDWTGSGLVGIRSLFPTHPPGTLPPRIMAIWEDDSGGKCHYDPDQRSEPLSWSVDHLIRALRFLVVGRVDTTDAAGGSIWLLRLGSIATLGALWLSYTSGDDLAGIVVLPNGSTGFEEPRNVERADERGALIVDGWVRFQIR